MQRHNNGMQNKIEYVYAIAPASNSWIKIGKARNLRSRLSTAQGFHIEPLRIVGFKACSSGEALELERALHNWFGGARIVREIFESDILEALLVHLPLATDLSEMCTFCPMPVVSGFTQCERHRAKSAERARKRYGRLRATGLCECGDPAVTGKSSCAKHLERRRKSARKRYARRRQKD